MSSLTVVLHIDYDQCSVSLVNWAIVRPVVWLCLNLAFLHHCDELGAYHIFILVSRSIEALWCGTLLDHDVSFAQECSAGTLRTFERCQAEGEVDSVG